MKDLTRFLSHSFVAWLPLAGGVKQKKPCLAEDRVLGIFWTELLQCVAERLRGIELAELKIRQGLVFQGRVNLNSAGQAAHHLVSIS